MSVLAARVTESCIEIAADTILIKEDIKRVGFKKLYQMFPDFVVGGCGSAEELCLFFEFAKHNKPKGSTTLDIVDYMNTFANYKSRFATEAELTNEYLIIYGGKLYEASGLFVHEVVDYVALGQGEPYALAALHLGHDVVAAVKTACTLSTHVSEPIIAYTVKR